MTDTTTQILDAINKADKILVCGHIRPDGDCVSAALFVRYICEKLGKKADAVCDADKPESFGFLPEFDCFCAPRFTDYDLFIAVDCATQARLGKYVRELGRAENSVNIDHHESNNGYCKINRIEPYASSTCEVLFKMFKPLGLLDAVCAQYLYTGLSTDTGHFMHGNTNAEVFAIASELCSMGVEPGALNNSIYNTKRFEKLKLTARAIEGIRLYENGRIALMYIGLADMNACGCTTEDTEGLIDYASSIKGVEISVSVCEQPGAVYRVSFRSKTCDVASACAKFGGGGHKLAAGCILSGNRYDVENKLLAAAAAALV